jgi:hypothetical protein
MGKSSHLILRHTWNGNNFGVLQDRVSQLTDMIVQQSQSLQAYLLSLSTIVTTLYWRFNGNSVESFDVLYTGL